MIKFLSNAYSDAKSRKLFGNMLNGTDQDRMCFLFTMLDNPPALPSKRIAKLVFPSRTILGGDQTIWWSQTGSNRRPHACKARALPTELWPHLAKKGPSRQLGGPVGPSKPCGLHKLITKIPALQRRWSRALKSRRLL